jgi:hypothetical protein
MNIKISSYVIDPTIVHNLTIGWDTNDRLAMEKRNEGKSWKQYLLLFVAVIAALVAFMIMAKAEAQVIAVIISIFGIPFTLFSGWAYIKAQRDYDMTWSGLMAITENFRKEFNLAGENRYEAMLTGAKLELRLDARDIQDAIAEGMVSREQGYRKSLQVRFNLAQRMFRYSLDSGLRYQPFFN